MPAIPIRYRLRALAGSAFRLRVRRARAAFLSAARTDCRTAQRQILKSLLQLNQGSAFARDFGLSESLDIDDFRRRVPVAGYELVQPYVTRVASGEQSALLGPRNKLLMFATTSGTTSAAKLIPVTTRFLADYRRGWQTWGIGTYTDHALLQKLNIVQIASSHRKSVAPDGTPCGNISGLVAAMQSPIVRSLYTIPAAVAEISDPELKRFTAARLAIADEWVGAIITANPSSLIQLAELIAERSEELIQAIHDGRCPRLLNAGHPELARSSAMKPHRARARQLGQLRSEHGTLRPHDVWPQLQLLGVWCGGSAAAYLPRLRQLFRGVALRDHGLHASEGRMTLPIEDSSKAGVLEVQTHFFEFLPVSESASSQPVTLLAHELQEGTDYFILLTTSSGLCRYNIHDVVRCVGWYGTTPLLEFRHKGAHLSSITGEKLSESQVVEAVQDVATRRNQSLRLFTLTPVWGQPPGYTLFISLVPPDGLQTALSGSALDLFAHDLDRALGERNEEYRDKRQTDRLRPVSVVEVDLPTWNHFTTARQSRSGGSPEQYKHPCLLPDPQFESLFLKLCGISHG